MAKFKQFDDYKTIKATRTEYSKVGGKWKMSKRDKFLVSPKQHKYVTDNKTCNFFRGLGGFERNERKYTKRGYVVSRNILISPDGKTKIIRDYDFSSDKLYNRALNNYKKQYAKK